VRERGETYRVIHHCCIEEVDALLVGELYLVYAGKFVVSDVPSYTW
jgi:hypothetical protein